MPSPGRLSIQRLFHTLYHWALSMAKPLSCPLPSKLWAALWTSVLPYLTAQSSGFCLLSLSWLEQNSVLWTQVSPQVLHTDGGGVLPSLGSLPSLLSSAPISPSWHCCQNDQFLKPCHCLSFESHDTLTVKLLKLNNIEHIIRLLLYAKINTTPSNNPAPLRGSWTPSVQRAIVVCPPSLVCVSPGN